MSIVQFTCVGIEVVPSFSTRIHLDFLWHGQSLHYRRLHRRNCHARPNAPASRVLTSTPGLIFHLSLALACHLTFFNMRRWSASQRGRLRLLTCSTASWVVTTPHSIPPRRRPLNVMRPFTEREPYPLPNLLPCSLLWACSLSLTSVLVGAVHFFAS